MEEEYQKQNLWMKFKAFVKECIRVLKVTKKPTKEEFRTIVKISGLGIVIIGFIGFLINMIKVIIFQ